MIVSAQSRPKEYSGALSLAEYAQTIHYHESAFWGVAFPDEHDYGYLGCRTVWLKHERDRIAHYLREAQAEIENVTSFPLAPRWIEAEEVPARSPLLTRYGRVVAVGQRAESDIDLAALVVYNAEKTLATITVATDADATLDEIVVFHSGTDFEISPSSIEIGEVETVIEIPRYRLVTPEYAENPPAGWPYDNDTYFATEVDVKRVYNDDTTSAQLYGATCTCGSCAGVTSDACLSIENGRIGRVMARKTWDSCFCHVPNMRIWYKAGYALDEHAKEMLIKLAHAKMPYEPCGCDVIEKQWRADRQIPTVLTAERINCAFGLSDGAYIAWRWAQAIRLVRASVIMAPARVFA